VAALAAPTQADGSGWQSARAKWAAGPKEVTMTNGSQAVQTRTGSVFTFRVHGMTCAEEVDALKREIGPLVGGSDRLAFDLLAGRMSVSGPPGVTEAALAQAVARLGLTAEPWRDGAAPPDRTVWDRHGRAFATAASAVLAAAGFAVHAGIAGFAAALGAEGAGPSQSAPLVVRTLYLLAIVSGAWFVAPRAWAALRRLRPDMNLLMTIAVCGATAIGEWFEAATVTVLFALSLALESWSVDRARRAVATLLDLAPPSARVRAGDGREESVPPDQVAVGSVVVVKPGEKIPLDGRVVSGASVVNEAPITGESSLVPKLAGDPVFAGTINGDGAMLIETTKTASQTTLALIVRMVGEAQSRRARAEQWVERFARRYTPAVLGLALVTLAVPPLLWGGAWGEWLYRALVLLVIGCPCALVISTPVSIVAGLAAAARNGVLIKGGIHLETPARLRAVALDKTGTLTRGYPIVAQVACVDGADERRVLALAAALEARSEHPLAAAILEHARERGVSVPPAEDFRSLPGRGATGRVDGREVWVGSHRYLEEREQETHEVHALLQQLARGGRTVVFVGDSRRVHGLIALADNPRRSARQAIQELRDVGVQHIVMLTGDNRAPAEAVARDTGVDETYAELLPSDKVNEVERLVRIYGEVAMVGDGVNDAPALARSSLGIAMGAAGSDAAIETADVALMSDDLSKVPWLIAHSRRTLAVVRQNITASLLVKAAFIVLTLSGQASLWAAIAADMGTSLLVIFNALRLLRP